MLICNLALKVIKAIFTTFSKYDDIFPLPLCSICSKVYLGCLLIIHTGVTHCRVFTLLYEVPFKYLLFFKLIKTPELNCIGEEV